MTLRAMVLVLAVLGGCADGGGGKPTTRPTTIRQRQDAALRDPMGYKQAVGPGNNDDITHLDDAGLKKDLNDVFNP